MHPAKSGSHPHPKLSVRDAKISNLDSFHTKISFYLKRALLTIRFCLKVGVIDTAKVASKISFIILKLASKLALSVLYS